MKQKILILLLSIITIPMVSAQRNPGDLTPGGNAGISGYADRDFSFTVISNDDHTSKCTGRGIGNAGEKPIYVTCIVPAYSMAFKTIAIGEKAFSGEESLTTVVIPSTVVTIEKEAYKNSAQVNSISFGENVYSIGEGAFQGCEGPSIMELPSSIRNIETDAFDFTLTPARIYYMQPYPNDIAEYAFNEDIYNTTELYVPAGTVERFKNCTGWQKFIKIKELDDELIDNPNDLSRVNDFVFIAPEEQVNITDFLPNDFDEAISQMIVSSNDEIVSVTGDEEIIGNKFGQAIVSLINKSTGEELVRLAVFVCPSVTVRHPDGVIYKHLVVYNTHPHIYLEPSRGFTYNALTQGFENEEEHTDVTGDLDSYGYYTANEPITENTILTLSLEEVKEDHSTTGTDAPQINSGIKILVSGKTVRIVGASDNAKVLITNLNGTTVFNEIADTMTFIDEGIFLVTVDNQTFKIIIHE